MAGRLTGAEQNYLRASNKAGACGRAAIALIDRASRQDKAKPAHFANPGIALQQQGRLDATLRQFDQALARAPGLVEALNSCGNILLWVDRAQGRA